MDSFIEATNAAMGSACSKLVVYPFDIIKSRMATTGKSLKETVEDLQQEGGGTAGLYKGVQAKLVKSVTGKFFYFYLYDILSKMRLASMEDPSRGLDTVSNLVVGYFSEVLELPLIMPLEAIVTRVQASKEKNVNGIEVAKQMYKEGGLSKFYVSLDAYILGAMQPAIQMSVFDQVKPLVVGKSGGDLSAAQAFFLGTFASSIAVTATYPMDMCRTIAQSSDDGCGQKNLFQALAHVLKTEGFAGLFKGLAPQLFQSVLSSAIMLMVKEKIKAVTTKVLVAILSAIGLYQQKKKVLK